MGLCLTTASHGASLLAGVDDASMADGSVDGWSGASVLSVPITGGDVVEVTDFSFFAAAGRADGTRHVTPLILARPAGSDFNASATVIGIGTSVLVTEEGLNNHPFSLTLGTATLDLNNGVDEYLAGFWQYAEGVDDTNGGVVAFGADSGTGMFQMNHDGTSYVPALGDVYDAGHASDTGGRNYQFNVEGEVVPEPSVAWLFAASGFALILRRRRRS